MRNRIYKISTGIVGAALLAGVASAHVVVKPATVGVGQFQAFTIGVPNERDNDTIGVRVVIPDGLKEISPTVKPGWQIEEKRSGTGDDARVTEIIWSGGQIPAGQRDDFSFSAQAPDGAITVKWKAYQTYADGTVVSWDKDPNAKPAKSDEEITPYSETKVINDLSGSSSSDDQKPDKDQNGTYALYASGVAVILALAALLRRRP